MTTTTLDHITIAQKLDHLYAVAVDLDRDLVAAGLRSWMGPRVHLLQAHAELHHLRRALDVLAGGPGQATPYVLRSAVAALSAPAADFLGTTCGRRDTGDDDRGASILNGICKGPSTATPATPAPPIDLTALDHAHEAEAHTGPPRLSEADLQIDVQTRSDAHHCNNNTAAPRL